MYKEIFLENILRLLKERQWERKELAARTGTSAANLSDIINGKGNPSLKTMEAIAKAFQVPLPAMLLSNGDDLRTLVGKGAFGDMPDSCEWVAAIVRSDQVQHIRQLEKAAVDTASSSKARVPEPA